MVLYGAWENGPEGRGPATLTMAETRTATNSITGTFTSIGDISAALGVSIGVSISHYAGYSVAVPSYYKYRIIYRPRFYRYKVVQNQYYRIDGYSTLTGSTKTCYVNVFNDWDFDWVIVEVY